MMCSGESQAPNAAFKLLFGGIEAWLQLASEPCFSWCCQGLQRHWCGEAWGQGGAEDDHTFAKPLVQLPASGADWSWLAAAALHSSLEWHGAGLDLSSKSILQRMGRHCVNSSRRVWASQKMSGSGGDGEPSFMQWQGCLVGRRT